MTAFSTIMEDINRVAPVAGPEVVTILAKPYVYRDPATIPPREFLYGRHYAREYISTTIAPGGVGKSSLVLVEAVAMVTGRPLLGIQPAKLLRVWYWNGEDPHDEMERRLAGVLLHYGISGEEVAGRLFLTSGRDSPLIVATSTKQGVQVSEPVVDALTREIRTKKIDALIVDPFVSSHSVPENDNGAIDRVAKTFAKVAGRTKCAIELVHHVRKPSTGHGEFTVDDARGAGALLAATRSGRVLNPMSKEEASNAGVPDEERRSYFRVDKGKTSMSPPRGGSTWFKLVSEALGNGTAEYPSDHVGVVAPWAMPGALDNLCVEDLRNVQDRLGSNEWGADVRSADWVGNPVAAVLGLDPGKDRARLKRILATWIKSGALTERSVKDQRAGRMRGVVVVGQNV